MTKEENALFSLLRVRVGNYIEKYLEDDQGHKSYEGTWELMVTYPSYFESDDFTAPPDLYYVKLHCYVLGPWGHYAWVGGSWTEALKKAKSDIENWIMDEWAGVMQKSPGDGANDIIEALEKNTHRIEEKSRVIYAEYIEFLKKKDKTLSEELALLRNQSGNNVKER